MGSSHSNATANITNNILNTTDINDINKSVVESAVEVLIKNAATCSSSVNQNNSCSISNSNFKNNFSIGGTQTNKAGVDFSCIQANNAATEMATAMNQALQTQLKSISGTEAAAKLNAIADASNKSGFGSWGGGSAFSNANSNVKTNITNQTMATIENIYEQNLKSNFNSETVSECIGKTTQINKINAENITAESGNVNCNQSNTLEQVQECKQLSEAANKTLQQTAQELKFKIITENISFSKNEASADSTTKNENTGPLQDMSGMFDSFFGFLGLASLDVEAPYIMSCCLFCCCILLICICSLSFISKSSTNTNYDFHMHHRRHKLRGGYSKNNIGGYLTSITSNILSDIFCE
jgi:hypothetical protein